MSSPKDILICLEGSPSTARALDLGVSLAREQSATLVGLAIVDEHGIKAGTATGVGGGASFKQHRDEVLLADAHKHAERWLLEFETRCKSIGLPARTLELRGRPSLQILAEMRAHDMTVIGRHANFHFETADKDKDTIAAVLHRGNKPILLVPETARPALGPCVMIAYDGSSAAKRAVEAFALSGLAVDRKVHIMSIDNDGAVAWEMAERGANMLRAHGISPQIHSVVTAKTIAAAIVDTSADYGAGLLVMGAYTPSRLKGILWGSVTLEVVESSPVPIFLHS